MENEEAFRVFKRRFWKLVFLLNIGPIALAIGIALAVFHGTSRLVWGSLVVAAVSLVFAGRTYVRARSALSEAHGETVR